MCLKSPSSLSLPVLKGWTALFWKSYHYLRATFYFKKRSLKLLFYLRYPVVHKQNFIAREAMGTFICEKKKKNPGTFLVVQRLRLHTPSAGGMGSVPGRATKIPHAQGSAKGKKSICFQCKQVRILPYPGSCTKNN